MKQFIDKNWSIIVLIIVCLLVIAITNRKGELLIKEKQLQIDSLKSKEVLYTGIDSTVKHLAYADKVRAEKINKLSSINKELIAVNTSLKVKIKEVDKKLDNKPIIVWTVVKDNNVNDVSMTMEKKGKKFKYTMSKHRQDFAKLTWKTGYNIFNERDLKIITSIATVEADGGKGRGYKEANNPCNIKHQTVIKGKVKTVCPFPDLCHGSIGIHDDYAKDRFCKYASFKDGLKATYKLIHKGRYAPLWQKANTGDEILEGIDYLGYATDSEHSNMTCAVYYWLKDFKKHK